MKVVVAIDSFKGSLTSLQAGEAAKAGILDAFPTAEVIVRPLADGGEGTVEALTLGMGGELRTVTVTGPLDEPVSCTYGVLPEKTTAIIEMSGAAGITLIPPEKRDPLRATTYGVGEVLIDAIQRGCRNFIVGIGGSATNDGGIGMLQALGFGILDKDGKQVPHGARGLKDIATITEENIRPELRECVFRIACDVTNPLCGENGCSAVFGPQKGASSWLISELDAWLKNFARLTKKQYPASDADNPGAGAAGGLGFAFLSYLNAKLESGIHIILDETSLENYIADADIVVTGEGRLDAQTVMGKAPIGVAELAKKHGKPVIAFAGSVTDDARECNKHGIDAFFSILRGVTSLEDAMDRENAARNMRATVEQIFRLAILPKDKA